MEYTTNLGSSLRHPLGSEKITRECVAVDNLHRTPVHIKFQSDLKILPSHVIGSARAAGTSFGYAVSLKKCALRNADIVRYRQVLVLGCAQGAREKNIECLISIETRLFPSRRTPWGSKILALQTLRPENKCLLGKISLVLIDIRHVFFRLDSLSEIRLPI